MKVRARDSVKVDRESAPVLIVKREEDELNDVVIERTELDVPTPLTLTLSVPIDIPLVSFECIPDIKLTYAPSTLSERLLPTPAATVLQGESEYPHDVEVSVPFGET